MFHVLLVLPMLVTFGAMAVFVLTVPFCVGVFLQAVLCVFGQDKWVIFVPAALGIAGLICSIVFFLGTIPLMGILIYWSLFFLCLWLVWLVIRQIQKAVARWRGKE